VIAYLLATIGLGAWVSRRIRAFKDYFLAGGALTTPLLVCSLVSTYYGLDVTFGTSETAFYSGLAAWFWYSVPYYFFIAVAALLLAKRLKRHAFMTLPDLLEYYYGMPTRVIGAVACLIYSMPILAMAGMTALLSYLGLPTYPALAVIITVCTVYTVMGGLWADAISDTLQFVLMAVSLAIAIPMALNQSGGFAFLEALPAGHLTAQGGLSGWMLAAWATTGLTVLVEPAFYQRIFAARNHRTVIRALLIGIGLWAAYDWGVIIIGLMARAWVEQGRLPADLEGSQALLAVSMQVLPLGLRGLFLGGILAAAMSTIDSYSLLSSGNLVYDIIRPLRRRPLSDTRLTQLTRLGVFVVMVAAAFVSLLFPRMRDAWIFMASMLTAVVLLPVMGAIFARPDRLAGCFAAAGGLIGLILFYTLLFTLGTWDPDQEATYLRLGPIELWQDCAALAALPVSGGAMLLGQMIGGRRHG
jgi:SSS family solute:Na+ symporter